MPQPIRIALLIFVAAAVLGIIAYYFIRALRNSEDPARLLVKWIVTGLIVAGLLWLAKGGVNSMGGAFVVGLAVMAVGVILAFIWAPNLSSTLFSPLLSALDGGNEEPDPVPLYSTAESLRQRGKYREALHAIQEQLQRFPHDFTGQMMMAGIYAESLQDLPAAEITIHRLCAQPGHMPAHVAGALNTLADWHLKHGQDSDAARADLERIAELLPGTEFARTAANRIAHLATSGQLAAAHDAAPIKMKPGVENLGLLKSQAHLLPAEKNPEAEAAELVAHLELHPLDTEARERLAVLYARSYGRLDLAAEQLEQLVSIPGEAPKHVAHWLNLLADLQVEVTGTTTLAAATLERLKELFPGHSVAELAEARLASLPLELKRFEPSHIVKLGPTSS